ncbi:MAG: PQQ-binding-like beta-propeller repeat protein [Deltaproteobacteria bacterium]|nr:PQQ-binding-like beta-propeller repeat protein [Deltaproteobacteria bacterium]
MMRIVALIAALTATGCLPATPDPAPEECRADACGPSRTAAWQMFLRDARHSGRSSAAPPSTTPRVRWTFRAADAFHAAATVAADGTLYVGSHDGSFRALSPAGVELWSAKTGPIHATAALRDDGVIYVPSESEETSFLFALNANGSERWRFPVAGEVHSSPTIGPDGSVYFCGHNGNLYALGPDGKLRFEREIGECHTSPALSDDGRTVYVGAESTQKLHAVRSSGEIAWSFDAGSEIQSSAAVAADGTIVFGTDGGLIFALRSDGAKRWELDAKSPVASSPVISAGRAGGSGGCAPGVVMIGARDGRFHALSHEGAELWSFETHSSISYSSPAIDRDANVYFASRDGKVHALDCEGRLRWEVATEGMIATSSIAIAADGTLYVGAADGRLFALGQ